MSGIDVSLVIRVGAVQNGRPDVSLGSCAASINTVDINFGGRGFKQWVYNLFKPIIKFSMEKTLRKSLCTIIQVKFMFLLFYFMELLLSKYQLLLCHRYKHFQPQIGP